MATPAIFEAHLSDDRARMFFHSSSYTANPIACAAARANLAIWRDEPVLDRIADLSRPQRARPAPLAAKPLFRNVRRSEERRVGKACVSTSRSQLAPTHQKTT